MRRILLIAAGLALSAWRDAHAQAPGWHHLDLKDDGVFGMGTNKAYKELLAGKKARTVVVAVIDGGIDTLQEDLRQAIWGGPQTGGHGWNFVGPETGQEDVVRLSGMADEGGGQGTASALHSKIANMEGFARELLSVRDVADKIVARIGKDNPTLLDFIRYQPQNGKENEVLYRIIKAMPDYPDWKACRYAELTRLSELANYHVRHGLDKDDAEPDTARGNADVSPDAVGLTAEPNAAAWHGTHVAGIIGAARNNGTGMDGVADHVQIMMLKVMGTIREMRDRSLARAIRFAVDHGAKVINLSFGKPYTWDKKAVGSAVRYAMERNTLIVCAAGNNGEDLDSVPSFPSPVYMEGKGRAAAWIEVGASGWKDDSALVAGFSNYGRHTVDVFAPGVDIYSTLPGGRYGSWSGTSMAAPMVSGLAALIEEYYPGLTALQVKDIIMQSVVKRPVLADKCVSGGVVNTYNALKLAAAYK